MQPYYYHSIRNLNMERLIQILDSGYILPRAMMENKPSDKNNIFNGNNWISLTQKTLMDDDMLYEYRSSYDELIPGSICFVIEPNIEGIKFPNYIDPEFGYYYEGKDILFSDGDERFSYYLDEVQTNKPIPTSKMLAVGYPLNRRLNECGIKQVKSEIAFIKSTLERNNLSIPIIDSSEYDFADTEEKIQESNKKILQLK